MMPTPQEKKRIGRFFVATAMAFHHRENIAETLAMIKFFPLRVEHRADLDAFEMSGISDHFEEIPYGAMVPMYEIRIRTADDGGEFAEVIKKGFDGGPSNQGEIGVDGT